MSWKLSISTLCMKFLVLIMISFQTIFVTTKSSSYWTFGPHRLM